MYYLLEGQNPDYPGRWMGKTPYIEGINFRLGERFDQDVPQPLEFTLQPLDEHDPESGAEMPVVFTKSILVLHDDLIKAMRAFGVDNIDTYDAVIHDPDNGESHTNYKAVNIVGLVAAADMEKSGAAVHGTPETDVDFDGLVIDEDKAGGRMFFRLAESTNAILVHEDLKNFLVDKGFGHVCFNDPEQSAV